LRVAWFAPEPNDVIRELGQSASVDHFDEGRAHDFVWQHFKTPYDVTVFELGDTEQHDFVWPYLFHYPGIVVLRATSLQHSRSRWLTFQHRHQHLRIERAFSGWNFLRGPLMASRLVVVHDDIAARELLEPMPSLRVSVLPVGTASSELPASDGRSRFHLAGASDREVVDRAAARAREMGVEISVVPGIATLRQDDVVIALEWPPTGGPPVDALRAMASGLPTIVLETESVAAWPTLDPQTWQRRGYVDAAPIAISIDPRDEEHSLMLAMRRLAADPVLRGTLGAAARTWAREHASIETAAVEWRTVLLRASQLAPIISRAQLPAHLVDDGTAAARAILGECGTTVDFFES
jgi:hypothetical protein